MSACSWRARRRRMRRMRRGRPRDCFSRGFGVKLGRGRDVSLGGFLGSLARPLGGLLAVFLGPPGASWGLLGGLLGPLRGLLGSPGDFSGPRARNVCSGPPSMPALGAVFGASWVILEASGAVLEPSGAVLVHSWRPVGPRWGEESWGPLGPSWSASKPKTRERQNSSKTN